MACYRPITAYKRPDGGPVAFHDVAGSREIKIKCGQCIGCRLERAESWAIRCLCEAKMHQDNMFITLTYDDAHFPQYGSLNYEDWQKFARRMRKQVGSFRFFVAGEYSPDALRPHFHALIFGLRFPDMRKCNSVHSSCDLYNSEILERLWPYGFSTIGEVNYTTARYCAKYTLDKVTGDRAEDHYSRVNLATGEIVHVEPEFSHMSLKPGLGYTWLEKYHPEVFTHDAVHEFNKKKRVPRYFRDRMGNFYGGPELDQQDWERYLKVSEEDNTQARLDVREAVERAKLNFYEQRKKS